MQNDDLDENNTDKLISLTNSILGEFPGGSIVSGIINNLVPNQRQDRITKYIRELEKRISNLECLIGSEAKKLSKYIALFEDGLFYAFRAASEKRLEHIASIVANGLNKEQVQISQSIHLLNLLSDLNDEEIIWLRFYLHPTLGGDEEFRGKHKSTLTLARNYIGASEEEANKSAIQESYKEHLERLGLIKTKFNIDRNTNMPIYDKSSGKPKGSRYITHLGKMLLKEIGFSEVP
ncbi:MAG: hypothetical protein E7J79_02470 [Aggregatibacter aphrophilus]|jgi:hypothetical protein|uniref:hypothetical protein n=1 Tax=Aggregatibacter aphrophilus TaxID=732 RepID=UPI0029152F11|nr:hypothetical protein [Aggregatibacter aphrophilus]MDU7785165.1 hypothetical protein [Aggregatibacter aphrophilus]